MTNAQLQEKVAVILKEIKSESFVKGYEATDADAMGLLISKFFNYDGMQILQTSQMALEDANFHKEAYTVETMIDRINAGQTN